jgi:hypothetical protein
MAIVSRILRNESAQLALVFMRGYAPPDGTDEVEINNDTPCYSLCLEGCGGVEELEL